MLRSYWKIGKKAAWRVVLFLLAFMFFVPTGAHAMTPSLSVPNMMGSQILLPFPMDDVPVGVSSAEITFGWGERQYEYAYEHYSFPLYEGMLRADYTIRFGGEEAAYVRIAMLHPQVSGSWRGHQKDEVWMDLDGEQIVYIYNYIAATESYITGAYDLGGWSTEVFANAIEEVRNIGEPYYPTAFDADLPAVLYTFELTIPHQMMELEEIGRIRYRFVYDSEVTTVIANTPVSTHPAFDAQTGNREIRFSIFPHRDGLTFEFLVIGKNTLELCYFVAYSRDENDRFIFVPLESDEIYLLSTASEITPREYFRRLQNERTYPNMFSPQDFLLRKTVGELYNSFAGMFRLFPTRPSEFVVVSIPFEPGQERILSISFPIWAAMDFNRDKQQSLFHYTVLTETAKYWDFFDSLTVTTTHPKDVITPVFPDGFELIGEGISQIRIENPSENVSFGFWMIDDERAGQGSWVLFVIVVIIGFVIMLIVSAWPLGVIGAIIAVICVIVSSRRKKKRYKQLLEQSENVNEIKFCIYCGTQCQGESVFCKNCGSKFKDL